MGWLDATGLNDWGAPDGVGTLLGWRVVGDVCPGVGADPSWQPAPLLVQLAEDGKTFN